MTTAAEKRHMGRIAKLPCGTCSEWPVEVHHITESGRRISHYMTIPLCPECHKGKLGVHGDKTMMRVMKTSELKLLAKTIEALFK